MSKLRCSLIPLQEMIFALPTDEWQILLVPDEDHDDLPLKPQTYTKAQLINSVGFLRHENMNGYHIYGRPITNRHILVDDLSQDALDQLIADGLRPAVVVRTSKANHQAWITVSDEEIDAELAKATARILAKSYDADIGSADAYHPGRFPGFTNRKDIYRTETGFPFTGLHGPVKRGVALGAVRLLEEAASLPTSPPSTLGACGPITTNIDIDPTRSPMTETEAHKIYKAELQCQAKRKGWNLPIQKGLRSHADYAVVYSLYVQYGYDQDDLAALLQYESEKAAERGMDYVERTVKATHCNNQSACC